jgi:large subunit ribosomal protein L53
MITRFLTEVRVTFNPFSARSKPARLFLSLIPPNARSNGMKIESKMLPRASKDPASLAVKFSASTSGHGEGPWI